MNWADPENVNISHYQLSYQTATGQDQLAEWVDIPNSGHGEANSTGYTVDELAGDVEFTFQVRAVTSGGPGPASDPASATPAIGGVWIYETVLSPDTLVAGDETGAHLAVIATFQVDSRDINRLESLEARAVSKPDYLIAIL